MFSQHILDKGLYLHGQHFYVSQKDIKNDHFGMSHFNWSVDGTNYHVLRTGCWPFVKYHCTKAPYANLQAGNIFYGVLKLLNFGIPGFLYGIAGLLFTKHIDTVEINSKVIELKFWYKENW